MLLLNNMQKTITVSKVDLLHLEITLPALAFTIPFIISGPQWLTGTVVNCFLFLFVTRLPKKNTIPIVILPSLGALFHGVVFGPFTPFLTYFLPFIWMGNYLLISVFSLMKNQNYFIRVVTSSIFKFCLLVSSAYLFYGLKIVPKIFITSIGLIQLITALTGGILSYIIFQLMNKKYG